MFYVNSGRTKIAAYDLNPRGHTTVVLIHGWPLDHRIYEYQEEFLVNEGVRVVSLDLRGFGNSDRPAFGYSYNQLAEDIFTVVRTMGLRSFTLAGFSMGGGIATRYMGHCGGYGVKKLALLAAASPKFTRSEDFPYGVEPELVDSWIEAARTDRAALCESFGPDLLNFDHSEAIKQWFVGLCENASGLATIRTAFSLRDEDMRNDIKRIKVPTGIFHGTADKVVPFELAEIQHESIKTSTLYPFEGAGHAIFYDDLEAFNECFLEFIKS